MKFETSTRFIDLCSRTNLLSCFVFDFGCVLMSSVFVTVGCCRFSKKNKKSAPVRKRNELLECFCLVLSTGDGAQLVECRVSDGKITNNQFNPQLAVYCCVVGKDSTLFRRGGQLDKRLASRTHKKCLETSADVARQAQSARFVIMM